MVPDPSTQQAEPTATEQATLRDWLVIYLKGLAMGAADAVPGVSGGTIALIVGIYERLIRAVTSLDPAPLRYIPHLNRRESRKEFFSSLREMDIWFLVTLGTGMVSAVIVLARLVQFALSTFRGPTFAFFFGLIGASAVVLGRREWLLSPKHLGVSLVGAAFAFVIAGATGQGLVPHTLPVVFLAGMVAISGMILPGISGAFILLLLGQYDPITAALNGFIDGLIDLVSLGVTTAFLGDAAVVVTFLAGALVGVLSVAHVVRWALDTHRSLTLAFLVSLMIGALRLPVIEVLADTEGSDPTAIAGVLLAIVLGAVAVFVLDRHTEDLTY
ncbi:DUF368 domain-containing protein [Halovenus amylolytica]|uniref:DUF368 domain-containing protein n=1 Tax=Halovenus amylolytica TaxID=2500550 RepID=UPI003D6AFF5C